MLEAGIDASDLVVRDHVLGEPPERPRAESRDGDGEGKQEPLRAARIQAYSCKIHPGMKGTINVT